MKVEKYVRKVLVLHRIALVLSLPCVFVCR